MKRFLKIAMWLVLAVVLVIGIQAWRNWDTIQRVFLGGVKVYETEAPAIPDDLARPAILVFSKTNGFRHEEAISAANDLFTRFAADNGWGYFQTENGATFSPEILARFDAVIFNNVSGDVFTAEQREALQAYVENGGGFVGIHGSGGDREYAWNWYVEELIGAQFIGHPMDPQFQQATVNVEEGSHPASAGLPAQWVRTDEWYSFEASPRRDGFHILATLDEGTYSPEGPFGQELRMGTDHPIIWWHCQGQGRALYSALGHTGASYVEPEYQALLLGATRWALRLEGEGCGENSNAVPAGVTNNGE
jgi:hypothetical protein